MNAEQQKIHECAMRLRVAAAKGRLCEIRKIAAELSRHYFDQSCTCPDCCTPGVIANRRSMKKTAKTAYAGRVCEHGKEKYCCRECKKAGVKGGGNRICEHDKRRSICLQCKLTGTGGGSICDEHHRQRSSCVRCKKAGTGGGGICDHYKVRSTCSICRAERGRNKRQRTSNQ